MKLNLGLHHNSLTNMIRCDESSYLIWKWHPEGSQLGSNKRENAIRWGSSLRVKDGEVAVFVYKQKDGVTQDYIEGPWDQILKTANLPVLARIVGLAYGGETPFQAEVYFINLARIIQVKFAVPYFDIYDPRFSDFGVPVAVRGTISFKITDYREFVKLHRLNGFNLDDFQKQIRDTVARYVKDTVANAPAAHDIPVIQLESRIGQINDIIEHDIAVRLKENFGVTVSGVDIAVIDVDKASEEYKQLMAVTRDLSAGITRAKSEASIRDIHDKQRIEAANYEESLRIRREEGQYAQHMQTQSANLSALQVDKQAEVGIAGAEALGKMGENGAGNVNIGGNTTGFNPVAMMAGMAVGGTIGKSVSSLMGDILPGTSPSSQSSPVPPPVPQVLYHVAIDGKPTGPYTIQQLQQMAVSSQIKPTSLVWTVGMANWEKMNQVEALKTVLECIPPEIPSGT